MARRAASKAGGQPKRILNLLPSKGTETDWPIDVALEAGALASTRPPRAVDLRARWWAIGDQGATGSCVGWATADGVVRYVMTTAGRLGQSERLSVRQIWMSAKETDEFTNRPESFIEEAGTSLKAAVEVCRKYGVVTEKVLPFSGGNVMYLGSGATFYALAAHRRIASYFNLRRDLREWKRALAAGSPILAGLRVDAAFDSAAATGGLLDSTGPKPGGGHAVAIVGYREDDRFIIRNSWGTSWGDGGFAYASPDYIQAQFFDEAYVVTV